MTSFVGIARHGRPQGVCCDFGRRLERSTRASLSRRVPLLRPNGRPGRRTHVYQSHVGHSSSFIIFWLCTVQKWIKFSCLIRRRFILTCHCSFISESFLQEACSWLEWSGCMTTSVLVSASYPVVICFNCETVMTTNFNYLEQEHV